VDTFYFERDSHPRASLLIERIMIKYELQANPTDFALILPDGHAENLEKNLKEFSDPYELVSPDSVLYNVSYSVNNVLCTTKCFGNVYMKDLAERVANSTDFKIAEPNQDVLNKMISQVTPNFRLKLQIKSQTQSLNPLNIFRNFFA